MTSDVAKAFEKILAEIKTYVKFAVPEEKQQQAMDLILSYKEDGLAMRFFQEHYSSLPDAIEEAVEEIYELASDQGIRCLLAITETSGFFYVVSADQIVYAGSKIEDLSADLIRFIDRGDRKKLKQVLQDLSKFPVYGGKVKKNVNLCPACGVGEGEVHFLGCVVEICPWCDSQLSKCNCRFERMKVEEITTDEELEIFEDMLTTQGRVPFSKEQGLAYPGSSKGFDISEPDKENV